MEAEEMGQVQPGEALVLRRGVRFYLPLPLKSSSE
jgi:hypothetical protein